MTAVQETRDFIDTLDDLIIATIKRRRDASLRTQALKTVAGRPRFDFAREVQIVNRYADALEDDSGYETTGRDIAVSLLAYCTRGEL